MCTYNIHFPTPSCAWWLAVAVFFRFFFSQILTQQLHAQIVRRLLDDPSVLFTLLGETLPKVGFFSCWSMSSCGVSACKASCMCAGGGGACVCVFGMDSASRLTHKNASAKIAPSSSHGPKSKKYPSITGEDDSKRNFLFTAGVFSSEDHIIGGCFFYLCICTNIFFLTFFSLFYLEQCRSIYEHFRFSPKSPKISSALVRNATVV